MAGLCPGAFPGSPGSAVDGKPSEEHEEVIREPCVVLSLDCPCLLVFPP